MAASMVGFRLHGARMNTSSGASIRAEARARGEIFLKALRPAQHGGADDVDAKDPGLVALGESLEFEFVAEQKDAMRGDLPAAGARAGLHG